MTPPSAPLRATPVAPDSVIARLLVAILTTAGLFYVDIIPALVVGLQDGLGFTPQQAGYVVAANVYGAAAGGLLAVFIVGRLPWRVLALSALVLLIVVDLASTLVTTPDLMIAIRLVDGLVGGVLVGLGYSIIARMKAPERTFAILLVIQFGLGGVGVFTLPSLVERLGTPVLFWALIAFSFLALATLAFIPEYSPKAVAPRGAREKDGGRRYAGAIAALAAVFLFQASSMGVAAYMFNIGRVAGLATEFMSTSIGIAGIVAIAGGFLVFAIGGKQGRIGAILLGVVIAILGRAMLLSPSALNFAVGVAIAASTHAFVLPYLLAVCAGFDRDGRLTTFAGFISKLGLASGPAIGALLIFDGAYDRLIGVALAGLALAGAVAVVAILLGRQSRKAGQHIKQEHLTARENWG